MTEPPATFVSSDDETPLHLSPRPRLNAATGPDAAARMAAEGERWGYDNVDDVSVVGDAAALAAGARRWIDAGADTIVFQPTPDDPDLEGFIRLIAQDVRPLIA